MLLSLASVSGCIQYTDDMTCQAQGQCQAHGQELRMNLQQGRFPSSTCPSWYHYPWQTSRVSKREGGRRTVDRFSRFWRQKTHASFRLHCGKRGGVFSQEGFWFGRPNQVTVCMCASSGRMQNALHSPLHPPHIFIGDRFSRSDGVGATPAGPNARNAAQRIGPNSRTGNSMAKCWGKIWPL